jgi:hypothetical protein
MIARALPATITNAVRAINKGVFFVTTSLLRAPSLNAQILSVVQNEPAMGGSGGAEPLRLTCDAFRFGLFGPANAWSYPSFPPPIQSELFDTDSESDPAQRQQMPGAFKPPAPQSACAVYVRTRPPARPRWGLCFCVSGGRILSPNVCRARISHLSAVDVSDGSIASFERCRHVCFTPTTDVSLRRSELTLWASSRHWPGSLTRPCTARPFKMRSRKRSRTSSLTATACIFVSNRMEASCGASAIVSTTKKR